MMHKFQKFVRGAGVAAVLLSVSISNAMAAGGVDISAETAQAKTDIATAGGLIIGVVVAVASISWIRRIIR